jgi:hypothetical protein
LETQRPTYSKSDYSTLLWSLWRLGVRDVIAQANDVKVLEEVIEDLDPPPPLPHYSRAPLLKNLLQAHKNQLNTDPLSLFAWPQSLKITSPPSVPFELAGVHLCFYDEMIGVNDALLIHYGPSKFEVSGYHPPISSISIPLGEALSALVLFRVPIQQNQEQLETGVIHISALGELIKGPWWPKLS